MRPEQAQSEAGFATLETIVAFVILSIVLATASQSIILSARSIVAATDRRNAMESAVTLLAERAHNWSIAQTEAPKPLKMETVDLGGDDGVAIWIKGGKRPILTFLPKAGP